MHRTMMKRGLYRTIDSYLGECAKVHESAGDAYPFLLPEIYDALGFSPAFNELPFVEVPSRSEETQARSLR